MKIYIVSKDKRYAYLNELLCKRGYDSKIAAPSEAKNAQALILPIRREYSDGELKELFEGISDKTLVLAPTSQIKKEYFNGEVIDYSQNEELLKRNARLTAEAFISSWYEATECSFEKKKILVCGYGRIGKCLCRILSSLGADVYIYARREESREEARTNGFTPTSLDFSRECDAVINTVPSLIFDSALINSIPEGTYLFELASECGFERTERVNFALGLPGKILPKSAATVILDAILPYLP